MDVDGSCGWGSWWDLGNVLVLAELAVGLDKFERAEWSLEN